VRVAHEPSTDLSTYPYRHRVRVRFAETDAMGIAHHSSYVLYLEEARVAFLRDCDHPYDRFRAEGVDITVLEVFAQYLRPARFDDIVVVHVAVSSVTRTTFQVDYTLTVGDATTAGDAVCARAVTVHACVDANGRPVRLPPWVGEINQIAAQLAT